jgi:aryl-alcohol dehydrogenase-like predicted oxidoreductase
MEFRQLGHSGLQVPVLSFGNGTFGGGNEFFKAWGASDVAEATRLVDICLDAGVNLFDTADVYSKGLSEEILGKAIAGKRNRVLISTKATSAMGDGPNDVGSSRHHLIQACEDSLRCLAVDALTPIQETLETLDTLVKSGNVRYIACSNFSGWHLMKSLSISERYVCHQVYYSLNGREYEMGADASRNRSKSQCPHLKPPQLGSPYRQNQPHAPHSRSFAPAQNRRSRTASRQ